MPCDGSFAQALSHMLRTIFMQIIDEYGNDVTPLSLLKPEHVNLLKYE